MIVITDMANDFYRKGRFSVALAIFEQLHDRAPRHLRSYIEIGFVLTGLGEMQRARVYLEENIETASRTKNAAWSWHTSPIFELVAGHLPRARQWLREAEDLHADCGNALLRTAYWWNGAVEADSNPFPTDDLPVRCANGVNLVAAQFATRRH